MDPDNSYREEAPVSMASRSADDENDSNPSGRSSSESAFLKTRGRYLKIIIIHHYVPSVVNRSAVMDSIHDSLRYVHGGGPIPSTVTGHKSGSVKTVPVMCHTSYCHGF